MGKVTTYEYGGTYCTVLYSWFCCHKVMKAGTEVQDSECVRVRLGWMCGASRNRIGPACVDWPVHFLTSMKCFNPISLVFELIPPPRRTTRRRNKHITPLSPLSLSHHLPQCLNQYASLPPPPSPSPSPP